MSEQTNIDLVKQAYAAFGRGDMSAMRTFIAPNPEWEHSGPSEIQGEAVGSTVSRQKSGRGNEEEPEALSPLTVLVGAPATSGVHRSGGGDDT